MLEARREAGSRCGRGGLDKLRFGGWRRFPGRNGKSISRRAGPDGLLRLAVFLNIFNRLEGAIVCAAGRRFVTPEEFEDV